MEFWIPFCSIAIRLAQTVFDHGFLNETRAVKRAGHGIAGVPVQAASFGESCCSSSGGASMAPVMMATASGIVYFSGSMTA